MLACVTLVVWGEQGREGELRRDVRGVVCGQGEVGAPHLHSTFHACKTSNANGMLTVDMKCDNLCGSGFIGGSERSELILAGQKVD